MKVEKDHRRLEKLLQILLRSVPRIEAPATFAPRVANHVQLERYSFASSLQAFSRRLVPAFAALLFVMCLLLYRGAASDPLVESAAFYGDEYLADTITLEYVMDALALPPGAGYENN